MSKYTGHRGQHSGLQGHSCGDLYPWIIVVRGKTVFGQNALTGRKLTGCEFESFDNGFSEAHDAAEIQVLAARREGEIEKFNAHLVAFAVRNQRQFCQNV